MYFTETKALREIEKMMRLIPNFPQRGHGVVLLHGGNRIRDDCSFCMHRREKPPDVICVYDNPCIAQRIRCGKAAPAEVFRETLYAASSPLFQERLGQYIKESEDKPMDYRNEKAPCGL